MSLRLVEARRAAPRIERGAAGRVQPQCSVHRASVPVLQHRHVSHFVRGR
eukprot:COSAG03_NODE_10719_length_633_cov_0.870787_2_plen_49_part_01